MSPEVKGSSDTDSKRVGTQILGTHVDATSYAQATRFIIEKAKNRQSAYVCVANVHALIEARDSRAVHTALSRASLVTPDGMPLVWILRLCGFPHQERVYGPNLMLRVLEAAALERLKVGLLGSTDQVISQLQSKLPLKIPRIDIAYAHAPPFGDLTQWNADIVRAIKQSEVRVLFVGLGCPKQEKWMFAHASLLPTVLIGVGAAFDFHAGILPQAPPLIQNFGLEWAFRLGVEPRRLWHRYLFTNPRFAVLAAMELARKKGKR